MLTFSKAEGLALAKETDVFLQEHLKVQLHPNKVHVRTWTQGVDFLGYILLPEAVIMRPTTAHRAIRRATVENAPSYLCLCAHADAYELGRDIRNKTSKPDYDLIFTPPPLLPGTGAGAYGEHTARPL